MKSHCVSTIASRRALPDLHSRHLQDYYAVKSHLAAARRVGTGCGSFARRACLDVARRDAAYRPGGSSPSSPATSPRSPRRASQEEAAFRHSGTRERMPLDAPVVDDREKLVLEFRAGRLISSMNTTSASQMLSGDERSSSFVRVASGSGTPTRLSSLMRLAL